MVLAPILLATKLISLATNSINLDINIHCDNNSNFCNYKIILNVKVLYIQQSNEDFRVHAKIKNG